MLHVVLVVFLVFFLICGIDSSHSGEKNKIIASNSSFDYEIPIACYLAVRPTEKFVRVNDTFEISCFVEEFGGKLDFYDGNDFVPESFIKVRK